MWSDVLIKLKWKQGKNLVILYVCVQLFMILHCVIVHKEEFKDMVLRIYTSNILTETGKPHQAVKNN